jgi:predicted transcriptional regulator
MLKPILGNATLEKVLFYLYVYGTGYPRLLSRVFGIPVNGIRQQLKRLEDGGVVVSFNNE